MNNDIISCSQMMVKVGNISTGSDNSLNSVWKNVVSKVHSYEDSEDSERRMPIGERLAGNTRVVELKKGILLIEVDHSGWIQYLRMYQKFIMTGLKRALPELQIRTFAFRITGSHVSLNDNYEEEFIKARKKMAEEMDKQDEEIDKFYAKEGKKEEKSPGSNLPPELLEKFESIKRSMLTNSEE